MARKMRHLPGRCLATTYGVIVCAVAASQPAQAQCQVFQAQKLLPLDGHLFHSFGSDVGNSGGVIVIGAAEINGSSPGGAYVFNFNGVVWSESQKFLASDGAVGDRFGASVAIDGDVIVVGAWQADVNALFSGAAYIFRFDPGSAAWLEQAKISASDGEVGDSFGRAVDVSGDVVIVGAPADDDHGSLTGSAYIFRYDPGSSAWPEEIKIVPRDAGEGDQFGRSVSVSGDVAIIGAVEAAYVYRYDAGLLRWTQEAKLQSLDTTDDFGRSVAVSGNVAVVGARNDDTVAFNAGAVYVFRYDSLLAEWIEEAKLVAVDGAAGDSLGLSVDVDGDSVVAGAPFTDDPLDRAGSAYMFSFDGSQWIHGAKLLASDGDLADELGMSVAVQGNQAITGAAKNDDFGTWSGSAYVFEDVFNVPPAGADCNNNGVADECEADCNGNGVPDDCDIAAGTSEDCNGNGNPDECTLFETDCNGNGAPDTCDVAAGTSEDCNNNNVPDECESDPWMCICEYGFKAFDIGSAGRAINEAGQVQGADAIWDPVGGTRYFPTLGGTYNSASFLNEAGEAAGSSQTVAGAWHAVVWDERQEVVDIGTLGGGESHATAMNDIGQVVGYAETPDGSEHAFLWDVTNGIQDLGTILTHSRALGMNNQGQVIGVSYEFDYYGAVSDRLTRPFVWDSVNGLRPIHAAGKPLFGGVNGINEVGRIAGWTQYVPFGSVDFAACVFDAADPDGFPLVLTNSDAWPFAVCGEATFIRDDGRIVGWLDVAACTIYPDSAHYWQDQSGIAVGFDIVDTWGRPQEVTPQDQVMLKVNLPSYTVGLLTRDLAGSPIGLVTLIPGVHDYDFASPGGINGTGEITGFALSEIANPYDGYIMWPCPADIDGDGTVGITDFLAVLAAWGPCDPPPASCPADTDKDGVVGIIDFLGVLAGWD